MFKLFTFIMVLFSVTSCNKASDEICPNAETYKMTNEINWPNCEWMLSQGVQVFVVINWDEFFTSFEEGLEVELDLILRPDLTSDCTLGQIGEIACMR